MKSIVVALAKPNRVSDARPYSPFKSNLRTFFKRYGTLTFFAAVLFLGMIFGSVKAGRSESGAMSRIDSFFFGELISAGESNPMEVFIDSFTVSFVFAAVLFCMSLSPLGTVMIPGVVFFRGFEYGILSGFLCVTYGLKGLVYYITVMLPGAFISSMALVYISQYCVDFSVSLLFSVLGKPTTDGQTLKSKIGELTLNCAYMMVAIVFSSLADTGLYFLIGGLFSF